MFVLLLRCFFVPLGLLNFTTAGHHPIFVSVTEIEHNAKEKTLEISCKIFTDDFEKALRAAYKTHIDLIDGKEKPAMNKWVDDYVQKHLKIVVNNNSVPLKYIGYEKIEEGIYCYFEADNIATVKKITITDNVLYEYKPEQLSLVHVIVNGNRKSTKLNNPEDKVTLEF